MSLGITYIVLAIISVIVNISIQDVIVRNYDGKYNILLSVIIGTCAGLIVKYLLDKKYIFKFKAENISHDGRIFVIYSLMGLATTLIFWGFEFGFSFIFATKEMRYLGGIIGLSIGYFTKYHLDKRFVFRGGIV